MSYKVHTHRQLTLGQAGSGCRIVGWSKIFGRIYRLLNFFFFGILVIFGLKQPWKSKIFHTNFTLKNVQKIFFSVCQNLTRNDHRPSLGSKEDSENYFWWFLIDFGHILDLGKKRKNPNFEKHRLLSGSCVRKILTCIAFFYYDIWPKNKIFISKKLPFSRILVLQKIGILTEF